MKNAIVVTLVGLVLFGAVAADGLSDAMLIGLLAVLLVLAGGYFALERRSR